MHDIYVIIIIIIIIMFYFPFLRNSIPTQVLYLFSLSDISPERLVIAS